MAMVTATAIHFVTPLMEYTKAHFDANIDERRPAMMSADAYHAIHDRKPIISLDPGISW